MHKINFTSWQKRKKLIKWNCEGYKKNIISYPRNTYALHSNILCICKRYSYWGCQKTVSSDIYCKQTCYDGADIQKYKKINNIKENLDASDKIVNITEREYCVSETYDKTAYAYITYYHTYDKCKITGFSISMVGQYPIPIPAVSLDKNYWQIECAVDGIKY